MSPFLIVVPYVAWAAFVVHDLLESKTGVSAHVFVWAHVALVIYAAGKTKR
jgi:hypothetical protein